MEPNGVLWSSPSLNPLPSPPLASFPSPFFPGVPHLVRPEPVGRNAWRYSDYPADEFMVDRVELEACRK